MQIQPLLYSDLDSLPQIQPLDWPDLRNTIGFYLQVDYCFSFKVLIDSNLVGTGTAILHEKTGWLSTIVTHNEYRKQGIGKAITEYLTDFLQKQKCNFIYLIATALGEPVYAKAGFITESRYDYYGNVDLKTLAISAQLQSYTDDYKQDIFELDVSISGEDRSQHLESFLKDSFVYLENEKIEGVYFPTFGDGLIVASTTRAGIELMKKRFQDFNKASFPQENRVATEFMVSHGFSPTMTHARMHFGKQMPWQATGLYNRVGGNIG